MTEAFPLLRGGRRERPVLSVLVPVYNEWATVRAMVERVRGVPLSVEIIAVNDGSTDGSGELLDEMLASGHIDALVHHTRNRGKGAAIRSALPSATGSAVVVQDADLEYDPADLPRMYRLIEDGKADAVFGSRFVGLERRVLYFWHAVGNRLITLLSNMLTNLNLTDMETGYKMIRTSLAQSLVLTSDRFGFEPEITARLVQAGARIYEVPISYAGRTYAEGKKITWRDGVAAIGHIVWFNLLSRGEDKSTVVSARHQR